MRKEPDRVFPDVGQAQVNNRLLRSLPERDIQLIKPFLERISLRRGQVLQERDRPLESAYFIEKGAASLFFRTKRDGLVGVAIVARYGLVGLPAVLGTRRSPHRCIVQIAGEALRITIDEFSRLVREPVGERELMGAQAYLAGSFPLGLETADDIALQVLNLLFFDLDVKELATYRDRINAVTSEDIGRVARQFVKPSRLSIVLVGDAGKVMPQLKAVGIDNVEVLPLGDLDLTSPSLQRKAPPTRSPVGR